MGDTLAIPLPVPAQAPLLARLGVLACEAVFPSQSPLSPGLPQPEPPVFPCVLFLACDLACLACTVQIKVVSTLLFTGALVPLDSTVTREETGLGTWHDSLSDAKVLLCGTHAFGTWYRAVTESAETRACA